MPVLVRVEMGSFYMKRRRIWRDWFVLIPVFLILGSDLFFILREWHEAYANVNRVLQNEGIGKICVTKSHKPLFEFGNLPTIDGNGISLKPLAKKYCIERVE